ncbi:MAG: phosphoribosylformylglycinamidine synthase, partial [Proteobacteria bacterium]|nr:phosphoribosylformylglycinamidine synthase [Pseudomonadota bacterium]
KKAGDLVYVLGTTYAELGASEYAVRHGAIGNTVPKVRENDALPRYQCLEEAIAQGLVASCHDCSDGGLGVTLAESGFAGGLGLDIDLRQVPGQGIDRDDVLLFSESQSRFVVTVAPDKAPAFEQTMADTGWARVGTVTAEPMFTATGLNGSRVMAENMADLKKAWQETLAF